MCPLRNVFSRLAQHICVASRFCSTIGDLHLLTGLSCCRIGAQGLGQVEPALTALAKARRAAMKVIETADRHVVIDAFSDAGQTLQSVMGNISFQNVFFAYPSRRDQMVCLNPAPFLTSILALLQNRQSHSWLCRRALDTQTLDVCIPIRRRLTLYFAGVQRLQPRDRCWYDSGAGRSKWQRQEYRNPTR